jgi:hypothetical protein
MFKLPPTWVQEEFKNTFGVPFSRYFDPFLGFDIFMFEDNLIKTPYGWSMKGVVAERYGERARNLCEAILGLEWWDALGPVPVGDEGDTTEWFEEFPPGTNANDIWEWAEKRTAGTSIRFLLFPHEYDFEGKPLKENR